MPNNNPGDINLKADRSICTLRSSLRQCVSDHAERIRKLQKLKSNILTASSDPELFSIETMLTPDIDQLLEYPLRGLD